MSHSEHQSALNKAKIRLMSKEDSAFFTTVCFSMQHKWDDRIPTAATNGLEIRYNPDFFMGLTPEERVFLLLHETMHVAFLHMDRLHERDIRRWNIAADHVINLMLIERGFQMPEGGLADPQYKGMSTEEVYDLLSEQEVEAMDLDLLDLEEFPGDSPEATQQEIQEILVRAAIQSQMAGDKPGTIPGDIQIYLNGLLKPKLPWNRILQNYLHSFNKGDYTFRKPNRRYLPDYYIPSLYSESLDHVAVAVDTSGSVTDDQFHQFVSEIASIFKMMSPDRLTIIQFDYRIKKVDEVKSLHELRKVKFTGRGGTCVTDLMDWSRQHKPKVLIIFTDGYFDVHPEDYVNQCPLIWIIHDHVDFTIPAGKVIHHEIQ